MTVFNEIISKNIDEFAEWLDKNGVQDFSPWSEWFDKNYCKKCESIIKINPHCCYIKSEYAWCELNDGKCKFFQDMDDIPYGKQLIKMYLESEG